MSEPVIEQYAQLVQMIGRQFGESCQAILYSLDAAVDGYTGSVIAVSGTLMAERVFDPLSPFVLNYIAEHGLHNHYGFINKSYSGLILRTSIQFICRADEDVFACFCIHHNIVHIKMVTSFLEELSRSNNLEDDNEDSPKPTDNENLYTASDIRGFLDTIVSQFMAERLRANNFATLEKHDKLALISELDHRGVFLVKGAVNLVAKHMNVSKFSIYNYLDEIRRE